MSKADKKREKAAAKALKKQRKAELKSGRGHTPDKPSPALRYAEFVRGAIYVLTGASLMVALALGQRGAIVSLDDIIESLFAAVAGKVVLALIGAALVIYGLKSLRVVR